MFFFKTVNQFSGFSVLGHYWIYVWYLQVFRSSLADEPDNIRRVVVVGARGGADIIQHFFVNQTKKMTKHWIIKYKLDEYKHN